jgi:hypothetical protein
VCLVNREPYWCSSRSLLFFCSHTFYSYILSPVHILVSLHVCHHKLCQDTLRKLGKSQPITKESPSLTYRWFLNTKINKCALPKWERLDSMKYTENSYPLHYIFYSFTKSIFEYPLILIRFNICYENMA